MSLYQVKFCTSPESTALGSLSLFAVDSSADIDQYVDYIVRNSMWWHYNSTDQSWYDFNDICSQFGLSTLNALDINTYYNDQAKRHLNIEGNGETLVTSANGGPKQFCNFNLNVPGATWYFSASQYDTMTSYDYYTSTVVNLGACGFSFRYNEDGGTAGGMTIDGESWWYFGFIPVFVHAAGAYDQFDTSSAYFIALILQRDDTNHVILHTATVKKTALSTSINVPYRQNSRCPVAGGGGTTTGNYQYLCSFIQSYLKVGGGSETHGTEAYNDPNNPRGAAYPAQGYNSDGTPINLFESGAISGIGGHGSFEEWRDDTQSTELEGLPSYLGGQDTTPDITSTGILSIYQLSSAQLTQLNTKLWSDAFWQSLQNANLSPLETVIALYKCKIPVESDGTGDIIMGRYDTGMTGTTCKQYKKITLPDVDIKRYYDTWLDQNPHTQLYLYLPYVGLVDINADYYMGRNLRIEYVFDFLSAVCIAKLYTIVDGVPILVETKQGQFGMHIPLTSSRRDSVLNSFLQITFGAAAVGLGLAMAATGFGAGAGAATASAGVAAIGSAAGGIAAAGVGAQQIANGMQGMNKYQYAIASHIQANSAFMSSNKIYLFRVLPSVQLPEKYSELVGNTAYVSTIVSNLKGLSVVKNLKLDNVKATLAEKEELKQIFLSGVYM